MPPKSTYFFPKLLTGLLFNPLSSAAANERLRAGVPSVDDELQGLTKGSA